MAHPAYVLPAPVPPRPWGGSLPSLRAGPAAGGNEQLPFRSVLAASGSPLCRHTSRRQTMAMMRKITSSPASSCLGGPFASTSQTTPRVRRDQTASPISGERLTAALRPPSVSPHAIHVTGPGVRSFCGPLRLSSPASGLHVVTDTATSHGRNGLASSSPPHLR